MNDCYVMAPDRSADLAASFLRQFLPERVPAFVPEDPSEVLGLPSTITLDEVLVHLQEVRDADYAMYFRSVAMGDPVHAAVFFNDDGSLFLMLSVSDGGGHAAADRCLLAMMKYTGAQYGYFGWEEPPVSDACEFRKRAASHAR